MSADPVAQQIGQNLRKYRSQRGMSLGTLAEHPAVRSSTATLYQLECGLRRPTIGRLVDLARALGVTPGALLEGLTEPLKEGDPGAPESAPEVIPVIMP